jgi:DNA polymerase III gamma/tau subunit
MGRRFLAPQARAGNGHGYYDRPQRPISQAIADDEATVERVASFTNLCDEPESPGRDWVDAESELAAQRSRLLLLKQAEEARAAREGVSIENRIRDAQRRAKAKRIQVFADLHAIKRHLARGKIHEAIRMLEVLEARLDGVASSEVA